MRASAIRFLRSAKSFHRYLPKGKFTFEAFEEALNSCFYNLSPTEIEILWTTVADEVDLSVFQLPSNPRLGSKERLLQCHLTKSDFRLMNQHSK